MSSNFERWEKDPFFSAAEEVQESADRMESTYRTLVHALKEPSVWKTEELRRDLRTALGTAKWQLEEFEKAVEQSYTKFSTEDTKTRHREFITAIDSQITKVSKTLDESSNPTGKKPPRPWVRLNEGETEEFASFLSGTPSNGNQKPLEVSINGDQRHTFKVQCFNEKPAEVPSHEKKVSGHRRTASAGADIGAWNIVVDDDGGFNGGDGGKIEQPPRKIPSFSGFLNAMDSSLKLKNGYRKLKIIDHRHEVDTKLPVTRPLTRGINACYERSKSCLENGDDCYQKQLYGWYGAIQRQLQRSQYYVQYSRPTKMLFWALVLIFLVGKFAFIRQKWLIFPASYIIVENVLRIVCLSSSIVYQI